MHLQNLSPWNWFKKEHETDNAAAPVQYKEAESRMPVSRIHEEIDKAFDSVSRGMVTPMLRSLWPRSGQSAMFIPQLDIKESNDKYDINIEVAGVDRKDINIELQGDKLIISGEKTQKEEKNEQNYHCVERHYGFFRRTLLLPQDADSENIKASCEDGVLAVEIKKDPSAKLTGKRIEISNVLH
ncbi:MAG: HSP20 family protein [Oceanicoccus sp.]|jgi:HSP20 family protein